MKTIALAGFFHETNTFSPYPADLAAFRRPATLPGLTQGAAILERFADLNVPITGAIRRLRELGYRLHPIAWASAVPSGPVTREAFETIAGHILDGIANGPVVDGLYLDLHGAMVGECPEDAETELLRRIRARAGGPVNVNNADTAALLRRIRARAGGDLPIVASFDLHANLSPARVAALDALALFRTYPHLDMAETGARAATLLHRILGGERFAIGFRQLPYLIPLHAQCTRSGAAARMAAATAAAAMRPGIAEAGFAFGFPPADVAYCGPSIAVVGAPEAAEAEAVSLERRALDLEPDFAMDLPDAEEAVRLALRAERRPVVIADTQDNPGAGGTGDTVGLLRALLRHDAPNAVLALLHDPAASRQAHRVGVGGTAEFRLGAHSDTVGETPVEEAFTVERLTDGHVVALGPMYRGNVWELGATALLRHRGVRVLLAERRLQAADSAILRHAGIDPSGVDVIVLKSSVHFRAEYEDLAATIIVAAAPGLHLADLRRYAYRKLRPGVRRMPAGNPR